MSNTLDRQSQDLVDVLAGRNSCINHNGLVRCKELLADFIEEVAMHFPAGSRERSLVYTKVEETSQWLETLAIRDSERK
jgi:hypothetical protein